MEEKVTVIKEEKKPGKIKTYLVEHPKAAKAVDTAKKVGIGFALGCATVLTFGMVGNKKDKELDPDQDCSIDVDFIEMETDNSEHPTEE